MSSSDRIEKKVVLAAPIERVWRAISEPAQFGAWFGMSFDGPFVPGKPVTGKIVPTQVDPEVAKMQEPHTGTAFSLDIDRIEPQRLFSFRWHPFAIEKGHDYAAERKTLVTFALEEDPKGTRLTITESGFDAIPLERRAKAFAANDGGWAHQIALIQKYLARA